MRKLFRLQWKNLKTSSHAHSVGFAPDKVDATAAPAVTSIYVVENKTIRYVEIQPEVQKSCFHRQFLLLIGKLICYTDDLMQWNAGASKKTTTDTQLVSKWNSRIYSIKYKMNWIAYFSQTLHTQTILWIFHIEISIFHAYDNDGILRRSVVWKLNCCRKECVENSKFHENLEGYNEWSE